MYVVSVDMIGFEDDDDDDDVPRLNRSERLIKLNSIHAKDNPRNRNRNSVSTDSKANPVNMWRLTGLFRLKHGSVGTGVLLYGVHRSSPFG